MTTHLLQLKTDSAKLLRKYQEADMSLGATLGVAAFSAVIAIGGSVLLDMFLSPLIIHLP
jgi:hypothetical protein